MSRAPIPPGSWGAVRHRTLPSGLIQALALYRDYSGRQHQKKASARTAEEATQALYDAVTGAGPVPSADITAASPIRALVQRWLRLRKASGKLAPGTVQNNEYDSRHVLRLFGELRVGELTLQAVENGILDLASTDAKAAKRARSTLKQVMDEAIRIGAVSTNPVVGSVRPHIPQEVPYTLTPEQALWLRDALRTWQLLRQKPGPKPDTRVPHMVDIMLAIGIRIGEVLALRTVDVHLDLSPPTVTINATLTDGDKGEPIWQDHPKAARQRRDLVLPQLAVDAIRPYLNYRDPKAPLFQNRKGAWMRPGGIRRILKSFRDEWSKELEREDIENSKISPHLFRKTLATMIANEYGVDRAKEQLGHASVQTTERHYVTPPKVAGASTVGLVDGLYRRPDGPQPGHDADVEVDEAAWAALSGEAANPRR